MNRQEYQELFIDELANDKDFQRIQVPVDALPGESEIEAWFRWMEEQGLVDIDEYGSLMVIDREAIRAVDPNMLKILDAFIKADTYARLDMMEEAGLIYTSVDDDGNIVRIVTATGDLVVVEDETD